MTVSRAQFLKLCGGTLIAAHLDPTQLIADAASHAAAGAVPGAAGIVPMTATAAPGPEAFRPHVGSTFVAESGDAHVRVRLAKIIERSHERRLEQFSLVFHAAPSVPIAEGAYAFQHPVLGRFDLHIAPVGAPHPQHTAVEASFSRPRGLHGV